MSLIHTSCGKPIFLDVSAGYKFLSPGTSISSRGVEPGIIELVQTRAKKTTTLFCPECGESIDGKYQIEEQIKCSCALCEQVKEISRMHFVDSIQQIICDDCLEIIKDKTGELPRGLDESRKSLYAAFKEYFSPEKCMTVLTIVLKTCK